MRLSAFVLLSVLFAASAASADDSCSPGVIGSYSNPNYDRPETHFHKTLVGISETQNGKLQMSFNIPCGTKATPALFELEPTSCISGAMVLVEAGTAQCFLGENPSYILFGDELEINTGVGIRVPGFDGIYRLQRN